jgi:hypothetical protein
LQARLAEDLANVLMGGSDFPGQDATSPIGGKDGRAANFLIGAHVQLDQTDQRLPRPAQDRTSFLAAVGAAKLTKPCRPTHDVQMVGLDQVDDVAHLFPPPTRTRIAPGGPGCLRGTKAGTQSTQAGCLVNRHDIAFSATSGGLK